MYLYISRQVYGIKSFAKDLLPVADQLQLALENVPVAELEENKALADLKEGIEMTHQEIGKAFEKNQIILGFLEKKPFGC